MAAATVVVGSSIYVGDLDPDVNDGILADAFNEFVSLASVRVCRDASSGRSLCYGYVNFNDPQDALRAIETKNHTELKGKTIRVMWSHRDSDARKSGAGNVFVKNLCDSIDSAKLKEMFEFFGNVSSCKVSVTEDGKSKGYGFVQFVAEDSGNAAIEKLNGTTVGGKQIYVGKFLRKSDRIASNPDLKYTNLYMKNLDLDISEEILKEKFSQFGKIVSLVIAKDENGASKGFAFVNYENSDDAMKAMEAMNGSQLGSKILYVGRAQKKAEREQILRRLFQEKRMERILKCMGSNVYIKNIHDDVTDEELRELFSKSGTITSAKIMRDEKGISKGFGFVCYSSPSEATNAVSAFQGYMCRQKPLYVAIAQRKEDRQAQLQIRYAHQIAGFPGPSAHVLPGRYPPVFYAPAMVPQVPPGQGLMYQAMGMRPAGWRGNAFGPAARPSPVPMLNRNDREKRPNNRGRIKGHILPQHVAHMQSIASNKENSNQQRMGQMKYVPNGRGDVNGLSGVLSPSASSNGSSPSAEEWSSVLVAAEPKRQKEMIGERLYSLVLKHRPDLAGKITGMLLEMDNSELLLLLDSAEALAAKVEEAVEVLKMSKTAMVVKQEAGIHHSHLDVTAR
ncbi:hypothetical protein Drorol1_Dr00008820 [Drosera rotundifolia]